MTKAERELLEAAKQLAAAYWPGRRVRQNYAPTMLRFLKAYDRVRAAR